MSVVTGGEGCHKDVDTFIVGLIVLEFGLEDMLLLESLT